MSLVLAETPRDKLRRPHYHKHVTACWVGRRDAICQFTEWNVKLHTTYLFGLDTFIIWKVLVYKIIHSVLLCPNHEAHRVFSKAYIVRYHTEQQNLQWNVTQIIQCWLLRWYYQTSKGMDCSKEQKQLNWFVCGLRVSGYWSISWFWCCACLCNALMIHTSLSWLWVEYVCMLYIHNLFNMQPDISLIPTHTPPGSLPLWVCIPWYMDAQLPLNVWHI